MESLDLNTFISFAKTLVSAGTPGLIAFGVLLIVVGIGYFCFKRKIAEAKIQQQKVESNEAHANNQTNNSTSDQNAASAEQSIEDIINKG